MADNESRVDPMLLQLIMSLEAAALQQMGKIQNPLTGKVEKSLEFCKNTIDMLDMIETKTEGNLTSDEESLLKRTLYHLRMNYVDELKSSAETTEEKKESVSESNDNAAPGDKPDEVSSSEKENGN
jgi:hypothetical protein